MRKVWKFETKKFTYNFAVNVNDVLFESKNTKNTSLNMSYFSFQPKSVVFFTQNISRKIVTGFLKLDLAHSYLHFC